MRFYHIGNWEPITSFEQERGCLLLISAKKGVWGLREARGRGQVGGWWVRLLNKEIAAAPRMLRAVWCEGWIPMGV